MKVFLREWLDAYLGLRALPFEEEETVRNDSASRNSDFAVMRLAKRTGLSIEDVLAVQSRLIGDEKLKVHMQLYNDWLS